VQSIASLYFWCHLLHYVKDLKYDQKHLDYALGVFKPTPCLLSPIKSSSGQNSDFSQGQGEIPRKVKRLTKAEKAAIVIPDPITEVITGMILGDSTLQKDKRRPKGMLGCR